MLTLKVTWPSDFVNYNVYSAKQYGVYELSDDTTQLLITGEYAEPIDIRLSHGAKVYVMNDKGATIDVITELRTSTTSPKGLQQAVR